MELIVVILVIVIAILGYQLYRVNIRVEQRVKEKYDSWKSKDYEYIKREQRDIAQREANSRLNRLNEEVNRKAREQYENWQQREIERITLEQKKIAQQEAELLLRQWKEENTKQIRQEAIEKSKSVITGKITEHFVPYLPGFSFNPKDTRFLGSPIDLIVFDGLDHGNLKGIWLVEVKTGSSSLSKKQRQVRDAVRDLRVKWLEIKR